MSNKGEDPPSEYELRREKIATAVLSGLATRADLGAQGYLAKRAVEWADALMKELDE